MEEKLKKKRRSWQAKSLKLATKLEEDFFDVMSKHFEGTAYKIRKKPSEFNNIYKNFELEPSVISEIYNPTEKINRHGISPDFAIDNLETGKTIYGDNKRQDGWVEGKVRYDGRGNAHERMAKYFTPGLLKKFRETGKISDEHLPFWIVLRGDITRDPCRVREITLWFDGNDQNLFFWRNQKDTDKLINHFEKHIKPLLD